MTILLALATVSVFVAIELLREPRAKKQVQEEIPRQMPVISPLATAASDIMTSVNEPEGLFYSQSHTWAFLEMNGKVKVGVDNFIQRIIGKIDKIVVLNLDKKTGRGTPAIVLKSGDRILEARIPINGEIEAVNQEVLNNPGILNSDSYEDGWILRMKPANFLADIQSMISGDSVQHWIFSEIEKLKVLLTRNPAPEPVPLRTMYDGGLPVEGVSALIDEKLWETIKHEFF